ncbi:MAG: hypothetical protein OXF93_20100 [Acidobacteria bacterium]|nr:hypothetical protein [Acidobacteriota bacterium]
MRATAFSTTSRGWFDTSAAQFRGKRNPCATAGSRRAVWLPACVVF